MDDLERKLLEAAKEGDVFSIETFIKSGVNVNVTSPQHVLLFEAGCTPLHWAARHAETEAVAVLLRAGANVHARNEEGNTPLHLAAVSGNAETATLLLKAGADPNASNERGCTPLFIAAASENSFVLSVLLQAGALVNTSNVQGATPLHRAAMTGSLWICQLLVKAGADWNAKDKEGKDPLARAMWSDHMQAGSAVNYSMVLVFLEKMKQLHQVFSETPLYTLSLPDCKALLQAQELEPLYVMRAFDTPFERLQHAEDIDALGASWVTPLEHCVLRARFDLLVFLLTEYATHETYLQDKVAKPLGLATHRAFILFETVRYGLHAPAAVLADVEKSMQALLQWGAPARVAWDRLLLYIGTHYPGGISSLPADCVDVLITPLEAAAASEHPSANLPSDHPTQSGDPSWR